MERKIFSVSVRMEPELYQKLQKEARKAKVQVSKVVRNLLSQALNKKK